LTSNCAHLSLLASADRGEWAEWVDRHGAGDRAPA
jgi:hypothetical protein